MRSKNLASLAAVFVLAGCAGGPFDRLDDEVAQMIRQRQAMTLGPSAATDPNPVPTINTDPTVPQPIYQRVPPTVNPTAVELPVPQAAPVDPEDLLARLRAYGAEDADGGLRMDLGSVLSYAVENAPTYRRAKEDLYLSALGLITERHLWGPRFFDTVQASVRGTPEPGDHETVAVLLNEFTVTHRLPYGGEVGVSALVDYVSYLQRGATGGDEPDRQSAQLSGTIDLPLLRGAGIVAREPLIQAERDLIYAVRGFERFRREFFVDLAEDYFDLILRQKQIENRRQQVRNLEELAELFESLAAAGREAFFRAERARANLLFQQSNLIAQLDLYQDRLDAFKIRIGMATTEPLVMEPVELLVPQPKLTPEAAIETATLNRLDLQTVRDRVDDARRKVRVARNRLLPELNAFADVSLPTDPDKERAGFDLDPTEGFYRAGMELELPLDQVDEEAGYRRSLIDMERAHRAMIVETNNVAREVRNSIRQIRQARLNLVLQDRNVEITQRFRQSVLLRQRELGPRDVIDAEEDLVDAQDRRDQAARDLQINILEYLLNTGQMRVAPDGQWLPPAQLVPLEGVPAAG